MGSEVTTKVRLVRCPKCSKVLPELPEFNVYKCGGCGATLQAKHQVNIHRSTESDPHDVAPPGHDNQTDPVREEKECSSGDKDVFPSLDDFSSFQNHESDQSDTGNCDGEQSRVSLSNEKHNDNIRRNNSSDCDNEGSEVSSEVFSPTDFVEDKSLEFALNGDSELANAEASFTNREVEYNDNEGLADNDEESANNENEDSDDHVNEQFAYCEIEESARHTENEESSREFADNENELLSQEFATAGTSFTNRELESNENEESADSEEECVDDENEGHDDHVNEQFAHFETEEFASHTANEEPSREFAGDENEELSRGFDRAENKEFAEEKSAECGRTENESLARAALVAAVKQESSTLDESNAEHDNKQSDSDTKVRSSKVAKLVSIAESVFNASEHAAVKESLASGSLVSPLGELKHPEKNVHRAFGRLNSEEFIPSSDISGTFGESLKSPTRSANAYEASISSYEGMDDSLPHRQLHLFQDAYKARDFLHSEDRPRKDKFAGRTKMNRDSDLQHQDRPSREEKKNHAIGNDKWNRNDFLEPITRYDQTARNWRPEVHDHQPSPTFHRVTPRSGFENGGPSNQSHEKFQRRSSFQSECSEDPEQMMKLLKMVFEMRNQRDKSHPQYDKGNDRISGIPRKPRYDPRYHDYNAYKEDHFRHLDDPRFLGRHASGSNYATWHKPKKIPFSGNAISRSHQLDPSCSHCFPQDWSRSAQLPCALRYDNAGLCRVHPGHRYCTCHNTFPPSPQWSVDSEYHPWGRETQSDDQQRRSQDMTSYFLRERHRATKRHFRPIAGGAPFVICYKCRTVLQLPADFLLFKKKCHQLKCSACSEVLKFSLKKGSHISPYREKPEKTVDPTPPTHEAEFYGGDVNRRNEASTSQAPQPDLVSCSDDHELSRRKSSDTRRSEASTSQAPQPDLMSCSDDHELSRRKSSAILVDSVPTTPVQTPLGRAFDKILFGSYDPPEDSKELAPEPSPGRYKNRPPRYESSSRPSSSISNSKKPSSEIQDEPARSTSPLHRLMGYSSPSQVIFGARPYGQQTSISYSMQRNK